MQIPLLDLKAQYAGLRDEMQAAVNAVFESQQFILGARVEELERRVAAYTGAGHAVGVSSGTDGILAALMAFDVGPGDAVITTPYTFFSTLGSVARLGARPVLADINARTFNLDPGRVAELLRGWDDRFGGTVPRVLLPVHLFGQCADMDALTDIAREYGMRVIEDAAQAIGAGYPSRQGPRNAGSMGDFGCFSFFPSKNLGGAGDGGMVVAADAELADKVRLLRGHGARPKYYHRLVGGNFRLDALQAATLLVKLDRLDDWHAARRAHAARYDAAFAGSRVLGPEPVFEGRGASRPHVYNQYVVRVPERDRVMRELRQRGIGSEIYYPVPMHLQECFKSLGYAAGDFPESERAARETLALPVYPEMTDEMVDRVAGTLLELVG